MAAGIPQNEDQYRQNNELHQLGVMNKAENINDISEVKVNPVGGYSGREQYVVDGRTNRVIP